MNLSPLATTILSLFFVFAGSVSLVIMMGKLGGKQFARPEIATRIHRVTGWISAVLYLILLVVMVGRIERYWETAPARIAIHVALAVSLFVLLCIKISIPRLFPGLSRQLFVFGVSVYLVGFVLVGITAGYYLLQMFRGVPYISHRTLPGRMEDPRLGLELFITRCSVCHPLRDILTPRKPKEWEEIVTRMVKLAEPRISPDEAGQVLDYLQATRVPIPSTSGPQKTLIGQFCSPCHAIGDIERRHFDRNEWNTIVRRMSKRAPDIVPPDRITSIVNALVHGNF
ncbi:MAG: hypothetical protein LUO89_01960 [Methanothrix sp.]|nr:hypothetical protein [Methanothrix sp.]